MRSQRGGKWEDGPRWSRSDAIRRRKAREGGEWRRRKSAAEWQSPECPSTVIIVVARDLARMSSRDPDNLMVSTSDDDERFDYLFKIVLIGDCGTGKTCVVQRFRSGTFVERHGNTIGVDFTMKTVLIDGKRIKVRDVRGACLTLNHSQIRSGI